MLVSVFRNFNDLVFTQPITAVLDAIRDGSHRADVEALRQLLAVGNEKEYKHRKNSLLAFTPSGTFPKGRAADLLDQYSGLIILDIDKLNPETLHTTKEKACDIHSTFACFVSPSNFGLKILVKVDCSHFCHKQAFRQVKEYYETLLNIPIDKSGSDISRLCFFSYDDAIYTNYYCETFKTKIKMLENDIDNIVRQIEQKKLDMTANYDDWIKIGYSLIDSLGNGAREYFHRVSSFHPSYDHAECDKQFDNLLKSGKPKVPVTSKTLFFHAKDHGLDISSVNSLDVSDYNPKKSNPKKDTEGNKENRVLNIDKIEQYLSARYFFRLNVVTGNVEYKLHDAEKYIPMTDFMENSIYRELLKNKIPCNITNLRSIIYSDFSPRFDPFMDYFNALPSWDEQTDYIAQLAATVKTTNDDLWSYCFKKWIVASVASLFEEKTVNHTSIIFSGPQGIGKTMWMENLCPVSLRAHLFSGTINPNNKDTLIHLSECWFINMDELENMNRTEIGTLKEIITKSNIRLRKAYGHNNENLIRRATFMGSVNTAQFLNDTTGSRRFLCFEVSDIDYTHKIDLSFVYAQALVLYRQGFRYYFDKKEITLISTSNEQFQIRTVEEELLLTYFAPVPLEDATNLYTASQILSKISVFAKITITTGASISMGKALKKHGFIRTKRSGIALWAVNELNYEEVESKSRNSSDSVPF